MYYTLRARMNFKVLINFNICIHPCRLPCVKQTPYCGGYKGVHLTVAMLRSLGFALYEMINFLIMLKTFGTKENLQKLKLFDWYNVLLSFH